MSLQQQPNQAEAVGVHAARVQAEEDIADAHSLRTPQFVALGEPDSEARKIEVALGELPGMLGGLTAEQDALGSQAAFVNPGDDTSNHLRLDPTDNEVIEEEHRDRAACGDVVDTHRHEVDTDRLHTTHAPCQLDLCTDPVRARHKHGVFEARKAHRASKPAEPTEHKRVARAP